jgi:hypothetical protein
LLALILAMCCAACSGGGSSAPAAASAPEPAQEASAEAAPEAEPEEQGEPRERPECLLAQFHPDQATETEWGSIDYSSLSEGYVAVSASNDTRLKFQIMMGEETYTYDLPEDGTPTIYPLNMGSGEYAFRLMSQVEGSKYTELWQDTQSVALTDEFQPYLRPNQIVMYDSSSACVDKAYELTRYCKDDLEIAGKVYETLVEQIEYDFDKAATVESGYIPTPDETLKAGKGICFDYASLAAAMLRSQGIPCQVITGYVGEEAIYHAWNRIYLKNAGWLTVEIKASSDNWKRVDITFASCGAPAQELEDEGRYTTRFVY